MRGDFWWCAISKVFANLIVKIAFVFSAYNVIYVVACCDSLYVRINFDVKKTAIRSQDSWVLKCMFVIAVVVKEEDAVIASKALGMIN